MFWHSIWHWDVRYFEPYISLQVPLGAQQHVVQSQWAERPWVRSSGCRTRCHWREQTDLLLCFLDELGFNSAINEQQAPVLWRWNNPPQLLRGQPALLLACCVLMILPVQHLIYCYVPPTKLQDSKRFVVSVKNTESAESSREHVNEDRPTQDDGSWCWFFYWSW